jgi:hypothetical protein
MGEIAERLVAEWVDDRGNDRALELANFAVQHLADMLRAFHSEYQRSWYGERRGAP